MASRKPVERRRSSASLALNRAFIFVKPHAVTGAVKEFVRESLQTRVTITEEGTIDAAAIDRGMLVDQHYYAIASKATLLKPEKLPVPAAKFRDKFGVDWAEALGSGVALNARDACQRFQIDAAALGALWRQAKEEGSLVKFGGGFYCARLEVPLGRGGCSTAFYVFNGFFMEMRDKYVSAGAQVHYFLAEWGPLDLSWADFRARLLGPTDPAGAPRTSIRGGILARWRELGLARAPDMGDNGVHASASPLEALFERANWLGARLAQDPFGASLLERGVAPELVERWRRDPQVTHGRGASRTTGSLYDAVEDLDVDRCLIRCQDIALSGRTHAGVHNNRALVLVKPHAVTRAARDLVRRALEDAGLRVVQEGVVEAEQIDAGMLFDRHCYAIASKATLLTPDKLSVPEDKFKDAFGVEWASVLGAGSALNASDACERLGLTPAELALAWNRSRELQGVAKFSDGFYCGRIEAPGGATVYVVNGFFPEMRSRFVRPGAEVHCLVVDWDPLQLSWADFRSRVIGPTDPAAAPAESIRGMVFGAWRALGLPREPDVTDNGVHASASPIEALFERMNWLDASLEKDPLGRLLLEGSVSREQIEEWSKDPQVTYGFGTTRGSLYACLADKDTDPCIEECFGIARAGHTPAVVRNSAVVIIEPQAMTEATKDLVRQHLTSKGLTVTKEGIIDAATIEREKLIDKHCRAVASQAALAPDRLPVPEHAFRESFGVEWRDVLGAGAALSAGQALEELGLDAAGLAARWREARAAGDAFELGGGLRCARLPFASDSEGRCERYVLDSHLLETHEVYSAPGAAVHCLLVDWDPLDLSWADFRARVVGPAGPSLAPEGSLRGLLLARWRELGLARAPTLAASGVHASASPFEALCERRAWLGLAPEDDAFGQLLLHGGVGPAQLQCWSLDTQVTLGPEGAQRSLFELLEDLDADRCVTQCQLLASDGACRDGDTRAGAEAEDMHKQGRILGTKCVDSYSEYTFLYYVEERDRPGPLWEVTRAMTKTGREDGSYDGPPTWSARKLTLAEAQRVLASAVPAAPASRRSPLGNRLPSKALPS